MGIKHKPSSSEHQPSIIIREDIRHARSRQSDSRSERTTRKILGGRMQGTQPASVLSPSIITREEISAMLTGIIEQAPQEGKQSIEDPSSIAPEELQRETEVEMNSVRLRQWADDFLTYPGYNPDSSSPDKARNDAETLIRKMGYGLKKLEAPMPKLIEDNFLKLKDVLKTYNREYMRLLSESPHSIGDFQENYLKHPKTTALCTRLIDDLKRFGHDLYSELADISEKEEKEGRLAILHSPAGQQTQIQYPVLAQLSEDDLRAYAIMLIREKDTALAQRVAAADSQRAANLHSLNEAREEAHRAKMLVQTLYGQMTAWLTELKIKTRFYNRGLRKKIDEILEQLQSYEDPK